MLSCMRCSRQFGDREIVWRCPCGGTLRLSGYGAAPSDGRGIWRYLRGLPLDASRIVSMGEGDTPLIECRFGGRAAWFKLDYLAPTGSYKDRGMAVLVSWLRSAGVTHVVEDSSGNAGSSMAAYCAAGGIACDVYVPDYTSSGKCVQIEAYGARLVRVPGTREDTTRAAERAGQERTSFYASHNWSPWFLQGIKTWFLEVFDALPEVRNVVVPVGQGSIPLGARLAMEELRAAGRLERLPRILAVQPAHCDPLARAFEAGLDEPVRIEKKETAAEGIASAEPVRGAEVLRAVRETDGGFVTVSEAEIWSAHSSLCHAGLYVEPTSAAAAAGWDKLCGAGRIDAAEPTVVYLSGIGLKATDKIAGHVQ